MSNLNGGTPRLGPIPEASRITGVSQKAIRAGVRSGKIPHIRVGTKYLVNIPLFLAQLDDLSREGAELDPAAPDARKA